MLGIDRALLRRARLAGVVHPRPAGRGFRWTDADVARFLASRPGGVPAKRAAAMLGVSRSQLARYRASGKVQGVPIGGHRRIRYAYDPAALAAFRG